MEARKETLIVLKRCRFCLSQDDTLTSLYKRNRLAKNAISLPLKILSCVSVEVYPSDKMPTNICSRCKYFMDIFYEFKDICRQADENILQFIENGTKLEAIAWPSSLIKIYQNTQSKLELAVMKTVVESGATVQLLAQNASDTDMEDDDNVYNVKIGDGTDDGSKSTRVKVITASDKEDVPKIKPKRVRKGHASSAKLVKHVRSHVDERAYPCKYCDKNFTKSHHYTRHLRLKHRDLIRNQRGPFGEQEQFRCDQCEDSFLTQDDLIYHSAIHATQNLICPLCQEKFGDVDAVTAHIKSHVSGTEHMCDYCELIFTTKEKLDKHVAVAHEEEEMEQDDSSVELDGDDEDDAHIINVTEQNGEMVVEIKKPDDLLANYKMKPEDKVDTTYSDESDAETNYTELAAVEPMEIEKKDLKEPDLSITKQQNSSVENKRQTDTIAKTDNKNENQPESIIRKVEEMKRKLVRNKSPEPIPSKKEKTNKTENNNTGASDKSLRLLEKELQDLKRTNSRNEVVKSAPKLETLKGRRPQIHTSTPKIKPLVGKDSQQTPIRSTALERKVVENRTLTKENKEPKDIKDSKNISLKEDKEINEKETTKEKSLNVTKNGSGDKNGGDESIRRSTRPSKVKDYAKMIRDSSQDSSDTQEDSDEDDEEDEEFKETDKASELRLRQRRINVRQQSTLKTPTVTTTNQTPRKRGRPRKEVINIPKKDVNEENKSIKGDNEVNSKETNASSDQDSDEKKNRSQTTDPIPSTSGVIVSPTGQTLKKVPVKALPPGVKPLPLPANAQLGTGEVCEMQIGKKMVKVQKIVMTKAEVEAMKKKGLVEVKDGTMVLKQGVNPASVKSTLGGEEADSKTESLSKKEKATPSRCDFGEDS